MDVWVSSLLHQGLNDSSYQSLWTDDLAQICYHCSRVLQHSVLVPLLFIVHSRNLFTVISNNLDGYTGGVSSRCSGSRASNYEYTPCLMSSEVVAIRKPSHSSSVSGDPINDYSGNISNTLEVIFRFVSQGKDFLSTVSLTDQWDRIERQSSTQVWKYNPDFIRVGDELIRL